MIFLDENILLELFLNRKKAREVEDLLLEKINEEFVISFLTADIFYHIGLKAGADFEDLQVSLKSFRVLECDQNTYHKVKLIKQNKDFEDFLQVACAIQHDVDEFYTLDLQLQKDYSKLLNIKTV